MKLSIKSPKGFSLTELLVALLLVAMTSVLLTEMLSFNMSSTRAFSLYYGQQFTVNTASARLEKDIERARIVVATDNTAGFEYETINLTFESDSCYWTLKDGCLSLNCNLVIDGLSSDSKFIYSNDCLTVVLMPEPTNTGRHNINVPKPIISQYALTYKK